MADTTTTAFHKPNPKAGKDGPKGHPGERDPQEKVAHLLMRTKGWSRVLAENYIKTLLPQEVETFAKLEDAPSLKGDEVNQVIDEVEDRQAAEEAEKKASAAEPGTEPADTAGPKPLPDDKSPPPPGPDPLGTP